jgi:hypothetical protein
MIYKIKCFAPANVVEMRIETVHSLTVTEIFARHGLIRCQVDTIKEGDGKNYAKLIFKEGEEVTPIRSQKISYCQKLKTY